MQQEAARAYDRALVRRQGRDAYTNYDIGNYAEDLMHFEQGGGGGGDDDDDDGGEDNVLAAAGNATEGQPGKS